MTAICIALLAVASSQSRTEIATARQQLQLISEALKSWDGSSLNRAAEKRIADAAGTLRESLPTQVFEPTPSNANVMFINDLQAGKSTFVTIEFRGPNWMIDGPVREVAPSLYKTFVPTAEIATRLLDQPTLSFSKPGTLSSFRRLWDALASGNRIVVPTDTALTMYTVELPESVDPGKINSYFEERSIRLEKSRTEGSTGTCSLSLARASSDPGFQVIAVALARPTPYMYVCLELSGNGKISFLPVSKFREIDFDAQGVLLEKFREQQLPRGEGLLIPHGTFAYSFRELNDVTKNYQDLPLSSFGPIFESEQQRTGDSFEALGIKFPAEETTRWGILIVLAAQLYLWIILRVHDAKLNSDDAGWEVAWIGLYPSAAAKVVCFFTAVVLPVLAIAVLGMRALHLQYASRLPRLLLVIVVSLSIAIALMAWKNFPSRRLR